MNWISKYIYAVMKDEEKGLLAFIVKMILQALSYAYLFAVNFIKVCYKKGVFKNISLETSVISVGNITTGGTGKTPAVIMLCKKIQQMGKTPGVIIRGYGEDEKFLLKKELHDVSVFVGPDRVRCGIEMLKESKKDVIILDDGFQHWRLKRDLDIVLVDGLNKFGNGKVLPRGILREPQSALKRADIFLVTKADMCRDLEGLKKILAGLNPAAPIVTAIYRPVSLRTLNEDRPVDVSYLQGRKTALLSGIEDPVYFKHILTALGAIVEMGFIYPDHYNYDQEDLDFIADRAKRLDAVVTTEKDAVKISKLRIKDLKNLYSLGIEMQIQSQEERLVDRLHSLLNS